MILYDLKITNKTGFGNAKISRIGFFIVIRCYETVKRAWN